MHYVDAVRAITALVAFAFGYAGHLLGDQWMQTNDQACRKALGQPGCRRAHAMWACAQHVITWSATVAACTAAAGWWLGLPLRPGWFAAGMAINAVTHFVIDLRVPLIWLARLAGRGGYIEHAQVMRPGGAQSTGPGTALFHLDQSLHLACLAVASLVTAGAPAVLTLT